MCQSLIPTAHSPGSDERLPDSHYDTEENVLKRLKELNPSARVKVHVLGFGFSGSDQPTKEEKLLQQIAAENGGLYQRVKPQE